ncbi:MAG: tetratricopeptide repeat protein [Coxiellaceae bacterium]|nr:tetratricopeptide repeat protein [Coxiellaceae bacterium]
MKQLAEREHRRGNFDTAKLHYEAHLAENPTDDEAWHALGILFAQNKDFQAAENAIQKALAKNKNQATYHNSLGNIFRHLKKPEEAIKSYKKALKINTHYATAYNNLGAIYFQQKRIDSAKQCYEKAIQLKNNYADAHCNLGILCVEMNEDSNAIIHLKKALEYNPCLLAAINQLGDCYLRHDHFVDARDLFLQCIVEMPENVECQHRLGICYYQLKAFNDAAKQFETVLALEYTHPEANQYLANTLLELKEHEKAMHHYFQQLEKNPFFETYYNLGVLLMMKERFNEALLYFDKAEKINADDFALALNRGNIHLRRNEIDLAITAYQKAQQLKPTDPEILHILSALTQKTVPDQAPNAFIQSLFNQYAPYYDLHLTNRLSYEIPEKIIKTIALENPHFFDAKKRILDLGCGTGLCGMLLKPYASELIGIDLSDNMLTLAREKNCYDSLLQDDITTAMAAHNNIDLIVAGDVFTYIGDLKTIFESAARALSNKGLFIFTVEKTFEADFVLQKSIRYAHNKKYLESLIQENHFQLLRFDTIALRKQKSAWIEGYLVLVSPYC